MADFKEIQIGEAGQVFQVKDETARQSSGGGYTPPVGGIPKTDLEQSVQDTLDEVDNKVDKVSGKGLSTEDYTTTEKQKLAGLSNYDDTALQTAVSSLQAAIDAITSGDTTTAIKTFQEVIDFLDGVTDDATLIGKLNELRTLIAAKADKATTINGKALSGNVVIGMEDIQGLNDAIAAAGSGAVSVTTNEDGTFVIHVGSTDYTVNLNHTHLDMMKLVVGAAADLPNTEDMDESTIYGALEDGEISTLYIGGYPFYGGGGGASNTPVLRDPSDETTIQMGSVENGSLTKSIKVKGKGLTQALTIELGGTGYTFGSTQPSSVTRVSNTELSIAAADIAAVNALNGISINVVYTGSADNATGTLSITSGSPDNVSTEVTLIANALDTDGLIGLWSSADAVQSGAWVDQISGMKLNLGGSASRTNDGYQINNLSSVRNAWLYLDSTNLAKMNTEIDEVFTCVIDCLVKFSAADMSAEIIDFGAFGNALSGASFRVYVTQAGLLKISVKKNGNNLVNAYENDKSIGAFALNTYVPIRVVCGAKYSSDGTMQMLYGIVNSQQVSSVITPPVTINFSGCYTTETDGQQTNLPYAFGAGLLYYPADADKDLPNYKADIIYKKILLYNKVKRYE